MIGNDFYYSFVNVNIVKGHKDEPIAIETYLGSFILSGVFNDKNINKGSSSNFNSTRLFSITAEDDYNDLLMIIKKKNVFIKMS